MKSDFLWVRVPLWKRDMYATVKQEKRRISTVSFPINLVIAAIMAGMGVGPVPVLDMLGLRPYLLAPGHHQQEQEKLWK